MPTNAIKDKDFYFLSGRVYKWGKTAKTDNKEWGIINSKKWIEKDKESGFQAKVFKHDDQVVIAFAGTSPSDLGDLRTDAEMALNERKRRQERMKEHSYSPIIGKAMASYDNYESKHDQFTEADNLVKDVKKKYPSAKIFVTGHSLGGALAQYTAANHDLEGVTFNAPDITNTLPKDLQKEVKEGKFNGKVTNYVNPKDWIGSGYIKEFKQHVGSTYYINSPYKGKPEAPKIGIPQFDIPSALVTNIKWYGQSVAGPGYHYLNTDYKFDKDGNLANPVFDQKTGEQLMASPRYTAGGQTIEVTPDRLRQLATELEQRIGAVESATGSVVMAAEGLFSVEGAKELNLAELAERVIQTVKGVQYFHTEKIQEQSQMLKDAASRFEQADED
ncbi:pimeloyl-ACP methyl ester carboxylesterase [Scopulibacillus daqui]|uniref:Pimeloyl-ACP methyl ester carboxylesterase n=1 Tax=Scopulibacillus daqui TaxID=1469162 RepID=A0ABS2Q2J1_9BACL|nr:DUF2974 domain-containing protein [Scopulibacillus daqui]MBM7646433.1 pimeloyl-ACP methyl ester carboxylesterase [Scopulibacillus daqui]